LGWKKGQAIVESIKRGASAVPANPLGRVEGKWPIWLLYLSQNESFCLIKQAEAKVNPQPLCILAIKMCKMGSE